MNRAEYLEEIHEYRKIWEAKPVLRAVYRDIFERVRGALADGPVLEIGSGAGVSREQLPANTISCDVFHTPWTHLVLDAHELPIKDGAVANVVLIDTLHHLHKPLTFLEEAKRVLKPGGRLVICEPYLSPMSYVFYRWVHREGADPSWDLQSDAVPGTFANQAAESILFGRAEPRVPPGMKLLRREPFSPLSYVLSGGFQRWSLLPAGVLPALQRIESFVPRLLLELTGWRVLTVLERV